ncbi:MAG: sulfotransferase family protein [Nitrospinales bacterium]
MNILNKVLAKLRNLRQSFSLWCCDLHWILIGVKKPQPYREFADSRKWVFIMGCSNSGTTLLQKLLAHYPDLEVSDYEGQRLTNVLPRPNKYGAGRIWSEKPDIFRMTESDQRYNSLRLIHDWKHFLKDKNVPIVLEKSPPNTIRSRWLQNVFKNSYFICIVRDGRAVAEGINRRRNHISMSRAANHWIKANSYMLEDQPYLKNFYLLKYEDLVKNPQTIITDLLTFINVDATKYTFDLKRKIKVHNINKTSSAITDFNKNSFDRIPKDVFEELTDQITPMMQRLGYKEFNV